MVASHLGHRTNPAVIDQPGALDRACARVWDPTPEQAAAGNYGMAHAVIGGLDIAIETPKDRMRRSKPGHPRPWNVRLPAHYGYFKRTEGADGGAVDVYIGDEAHRAVELSAWIMDQCDADTRGYDEHKVFIGFPDRESAHRAYLGAFSDGRGQERIGGVVRMTFEGLKNWLTSSDTKKPVVMRKSASIFVTAASYSPPTCDCNGTPGGSMTEPVAKAETSVTGLGKIMAFMSKGMSRLTPTEQAEVMAEAATLAKSELGKASDSMHRFEGERGNVDQIEDQWDGPPDDRLRVGGGYGPGSSAAPGEVNVGPEERASGDGAEKMERDYSRHAVRQTGVQRATEELGEDIMGIRGRRERSRGYSEGYGRSIKSIISAMEAQGLQIDLLKSSVAITPGPDAAAIEKMIGDAVAKAMAPVMKSVKQLALRKADKEDEKDEKEEKDDKEEASKAWEKDEDEKDEDAEEEEETVRKASEEDDDVKDEDDDEKDEASKAIVAQAIQFRQMAKSRIKWANKRLVKAEEHAEAGRPLKAERFRSMGKSNLRKAASYMDAARAIRAGHDGSGTESLMKAIAKAKAKVRPSHNQDVWPNKGETGTGKSQTDAPVDQTPTIKALQIGIENMNKAASGFGLLVTNMQGLMESVAGQSRGGGNGMPPALKLAMSKGGDMSVKDAALVALAENSVISFDDVDNARDVMRLSATPVAAEVVSQKIARLPKPARDILTGQAA